MPYQAHLTARAERDIAEILDWFERQSARPAATRWLKAFLAALNRLEAGADRYPRAAEADEIGEDIREIHIGRRSGVYRVLFQIAPHGLHLARSPCGTRHRSASRSFGLGESTTADSRPSPPGLIRLPSPVEREFALVLRAG